MRRDLGSLDRLWHRQRRYDLRRIGHLLVRFFPRHCSFLPRLTYCFSSVFRLWCGPRADKIEEANLQWALWSEVIREGGFVMALMVRYSLIPSHRASHQVLYSSLSQC